MISVVCVYNNKQALGSILLPRLQNQAASFELILLDNTGGRFKSAAEALNYGAKKASGKYIMFVHQDVELDSDLWLQKVENLLEAIPELGIAGVAGMSENDKTLSGDSGRPIKWGRVKYWLINNKIS